MMRRKDVQEGESELCQPHMHMIYLEKRYTGDCRRYLKAVQLENGIKIQLGMIKKLIDLGEENQAEETKERIIQKMKDKTDTIIDEALEPTEIQNF